MARRERDEKGRFLPGHTVSVGNRGNTQPKYGNKNAMKHGFFSHQLFDMKIEGDVLTLSALHRFVSIEFYKNEWRLDDTGEGFYIWGEKALWASEILGWSMQRVSARSAVVDPIFDEAAARKCIKFRKSNRPALYR